MIDGAPALPAGLTERIRPGAFAHERIIEVNPAFEELLPHRGLRRGTTVGIEGGAGLSLALAVAARATNEGSWLAVVGIPGLGVAAAAELGVALERVFLVAPPPARHWAEVVATAVDGADIVVVAPSTQIRAADIRRVQARVQARGAVLVVVGAASAWGPELRLVATPLGWEGVGAGHGRLTARRVLIELDGRRAGRPTRREYWLPGRTGGVEEVGPPTITLQPRVAG